jgi:predicted phosphodiesterase
MRTAIVSDLHLGAITCTDLVRDPEICVTLLDELSGADRVVLLGDVLELRDRPAGEIVDLASPFLELLGTAVGGGEVVFVPGNHDHRLAEALLEARSLGRTKRLDLEHRFHPTTELAAEIAERLRPAHFTLAYPGLRLRDDLWVTHGHYLDCHMAIPTIECLSAATTMRMVGAIPDPATPDDYERAIAPLHGFGWGFAQARGPERIGGRARPTTSAWRRLNGDRSGHPGTRFLGSVAFPLAAWAIGRALGRRFDTDISVENISRAGLAAIREVMERLGVEAEYVVFGHTHRPGPLEMDSIGEWRLASGTHLHSAGSWAYSPGLCGPTPEGSLFWPGTVTWVDEEGPPIRQELLHRRSRTELAAAVRRISTAGFPAPSTPKLKQLRL